MHAAEFVPLADVVLRRNAAAPPPAEPPPGAEEAEESAVRDEPCADALVTNAAALRDARLFRARLADAFDDASAQLLRDLAARVLARELRSAPCDLAALLRQTLERAPCVRVRVAPCDAGADYGVPVVVDAGLDAGDAIVELAGGSLDARLGVRVASVLEAFA